MACVSFFLFNYLTGPGSESAITTQTWNTSMTELGGSLKVQSVSIVLFFLGGFTILFFLGEREGKEFGVLK
jgi:hypothetical protein